MRRIHIHLDTPTEKRNRLEAWTEESFFRTLHIMICGTIRIGFWLDARATKMIPRCACRATCSNSYCFHWIDHRDGGIYCFGICMVLDSPGNSKVQYMTAWSLAIFPLVPIRSAISCWLVSGMSQAMRVDGRQRYLMCLCSTTGGQHISRDLYGCFITCVVRRSTDACSGWDSGSTIHRFIDSSIHLSITARGLARCRSTMTRLVLISHWRLLFDYSCS